MRTSSILSVATICGSAAARIVGLAAPSVIAPDSEIEITLITQNYIQSVKDISAAFSLASGACPDYLGQTYLGSFYLGPDKSNVLTNITFTVHTPADITATRYLNGAVTSLYGVSNGPTTLIFHVPVNDGNATSTTLSSTYSGDNICSAAASSSATTLTSTPVSTPTPTSSTPPASSTVRDSACYPDVGYGDVQSLIQTSQIQIGTLINDLAQGSNATAPADVFNARHTIDFLYRSVVPPPEGCVSIPTSPWPPLSPSDSVIRATQMFGDVQGALNSLSGAALQCDSSAVVSIMCQVLHLFADATAYFSS